MDKQRSRLIYWFQSLIWWERKLVLWYAFGLFARRGLLPAFGFQTIAILFATWQFPRQPLLWCLVFVLSMVYALLIQSFMRR